MYASRRHHQLFSFPRALFVFGNEQLIDGNVNEQPTHATNFSKFCNKCAWHTIIIMYKCINIVYKQNSGWCKQSKKSKKELAAAQLHVVIIMIISGQEYGTLSICRVPGITGGEVMYKHFWRSGFSSGTDLLQMREVVTVGRCSVADEEHAANSGSF